MVVEMIETEATATTGVPVDESTTGTLAAIRPIGPTATDGDRLSSASDELVGRRAERDSVERLLDGARAGRSGVLVVRGEAGIGKTALVDHTHRLAIAAGFQVHSATGVKSETRFAYAGLHQLCAPLLDEHETALPDFQRAALDVAFGRTDDTPSSHFLLGLAVLHLLADATERRPLLCLVDDAQWMDEASAEVLAFVARRVAAERIAFVFVLRDDADVDARWFDDLPELRLEGLNDLEARTLLNAAVRSPLDDRVRDQIVAEARGNPLALLEFPRRVHTAHRAGGFELPDALAVPRRIEESFQLRAASLPDDTQLTLLLAAAEPTGDVELLLRAAAQLGVGPEAVEPAEAAGLLAIDTRVRFHHPLVRSAVYRAATPPDRRRAHGALAEATDARVDPDRRAWQRGQAVLSADEEVAAELASAAGRVRARGGVAASAAFLQRAAELSPEPGPRASRALEAAHLKHEAGASEAALELLALAAAGPLDPLQGARLELLGAQIAFHSSRSNEASRMLLAAAQTLAPLDVTRARETFLQAMEAAIITGGRGLSLGEVAQAAAAAPPPSGLPGPADHLLDGLVTTCTQGYEASVPALRSALEAFCDDGPTSHARPRDADLRWLWLASRTAVALFDDRLAFELATRHVRLARQAGALAALPAALTALSVTLVLGGQLGQATELTAEEDELRLATGTVPLRRRSNVVLAGWRGRQSDVDDLGINAVAAGQQTSIALYARAVLHNGLGNYAAALDAAEGARESNELLNGSMVLPELIEAAVRAGRPERAAVALEQLTVRANASGTDWALGLAAYGRGLCTDGPAAEAHYVEAVDRLERCKMATHRARAHLVYGEWLRRERRRRDARTQLRTAHRLFSDMGAEAFAQRAASELRATGEHPRQRTAQPADDLTPQELHITRLVAAGATNREVGAQLFLSPRTIEAHLRNIFRKLDVTSRRQLKDVRLP